MKLAMANLEEYQKLSDEELLTQMVSLQMELRKVEESRDSDHELSAAIALAQSLRAEYTMRITQIKKLQKTCYELAAMRGLR